MRNLEPILVSIGEAAILLRVSRAAFAKLLEAGEVAAVRMGEQILIPTRSLRDFAASLPPYEPAGKMQKEDTPKTKPDVATNRILRAKAVATRTGLARSTIYMRAAAGTFPAKISLGGRASGWRESEVDVWIADPAAYRA